MDTKEDLLLEAQTKKRELLNLIGRIIHFYDDRAEVLYFRARRFKFAGWAALAVGLVILGVYVAGDITTNGYWNFVGVASLVMVGVAAFLMMFYLHFSEGSTHCESRLDYMFRMELDIQAQQETAETAAKYLSENRTKYMVFARQYMEAQMQYGCPDTDYEEQVSVGDTYKLHKTISEIDKSVSNTKMTDAQAAVAMVGISEVIQGLSS